MTIIEQIKAEIERRIELHDSLSSNAESEMIANLEIGAAQALEDLLPFLSTIESEKTMNQDELENEAVNYCFDNGLNLSPRVATDFARHFAQWGAEHLADARKTSPNDLKEAADNHIRRVVDAAGHPGWDWTTQDIADAFIAGAKWQAEQLLKSSPLPEDTVLFNKGVAEGRRLEEEEQADLFTIVALDAAQRAKEQMMKDGLDAIKSGQSNKIEKTIAGVFVKYGMDRQKEQMMKEAVEGIVTESYGYEKNENGEWRQVVSTIIRINVEKYSPGDKVCVIVCKKED